MDSSVRNGMKLSLVEVPNVAGVLSCAKKVLLVHILANKTETETLASSQLSYHEPYRYRNSHE